MRARSVGVVAFALVVVATNRPARAEDPPREPAPPAAPAASLYDLIARAVGQGHRSDDAAVAALLRRKSEDVVPALQKALEAEKGFHERITLGYLLAAHGEKAGLEVLVVSLEETGHVGYVYLTRVAPEDFGWNRDGSSLAKWREWLEKLTEDEYRERVRRSKMPRNARRAGDDAMKGAAKALADGGERATVAQRFRSVVETFPDSDAAPQAAEIANDLEELRRADAAWKEPAQPPAAGSPERLAWIVHHLQDQRGFERHSVDYVTVLPARRRGEAAVETLATELLAMGAQAVPTLLELLEDRRPIRAFGGSMRREGDHSWASRLVVLRVQDVALEILNALLPPPTYERKYTATYLSDEDPSDREATIADVRSWAAQTMGKSEDERRWAGLRRGSVANALAALRRLGAEGKQDAKLAVLAELRRMYDGGRPAVYRPEICELMGEFGDTSKVSDVIEALERGDYTLSLITEDGDRAVGIRAQAAAERVRAKYGAAAKPAGSK